MGKILIPALTAPLPQSPPPVHHHNSSRRVVHLLDLFLAQLLIIFTGNLNAFEQLLLDFVASDAEKNGFVGNLKAG